MCMAEQIKNSLDSTTWKKIGKSALLLIGGFIAGDGGVSLLQCVTDADLGAYKVPAVLVSTFVINAIREYIKGKPKEE